MSFKSCAENGESGRKSDALVIEGIHQKIEAVNVFSS